MDENQSVIKGEVSQEVIATLIALMSKTVGEAAIAMLLKRLQEQGELEGSSLVIACAEEVENVFGSQGAYAILRQVGRDLSDSIAADAVEADYPGILATTLNDLGFAAGIHVGDHHADICQCVFFDQISAAKRQPIDHPVCWAGWGFIEGFMQKINGTHHIQWEGRDNQAKACRFRYYRTLTEAAG